MTDDLIGQTLGQYRIEALLGSGGMGQVFRGVHQLLDRPAAIKIMQAHLAANPDFRARFLQEARTAAALRHANVVEIYEFGEQGGNLYLVMELMTDGSLRTILRRNAGQPLPLAVGLDLIRQAANGLAAANALNMIHRDIKPDNLLLIRQSGPQQGGGQYLLKISDFGLARLAEGGGLTTTGVPMGTLAYMSPEQCQGKKLDGRSDLYSLGVVLYEVVTGYQPFQINDFSEALDKHVNMPPPPPGHQRPDLPPGVEEIVLRCLTKRPEERYATGTELASVLQRVLSTMGPQAITALPPVPEQITPTGGTVLEPPGAGGTPPPVVSTLATYTAVPRVRVLDQSGQTLQVVEVKRQGLIVGRQPGNDIVLQGQAVSRQHLQVLWDGQQVTVKDLGSSNGTLLGDVRLLPQADQPWMERQMIRIGPFWLRLEGPNPAGTQTAQTAAPQTVVFGAGTQVSATLVRSGRIGMAINPRMLTITPGQQASVQVTLSNLGTIVDWFTTTIEGVAPEWLQGAGQEVQLNPGTQETIELYVNVARSANNLAGEYPVTIRARSREQPGESGAVQVRWNVLPFKEEALRLEPRRAGGRGSASYTVTLHNNGNTPSHFELSGEDDEQKLAYHFEQTSTALEPGKEGKVPLKVAVGRKWLGRDQHKPFQVHARPAGSSIPLSTPGEFVNKPLLPGWLLTAVGVVAVGAIALGALFHVPPFPGPPPTASPTPTIAQVATLSGTSLTASSTTLPTVSSASTPSPVVAPVTSPTSTGVTPVVTVTPTAISSGTPGSGVVVNSDGSLVRGANNVSATTRPGPGRYEITFNQDVSQCAYTATVGDPANALVYNPGLVFTAGGHSSSGGADPMGVYVETKNLGGGLSDAPFHLNVNCRSLYAVVNSDGSLVRGATDVSATTRLGPGRYEITFSQDVSNCAYTATIGDPANALVYNPGLVFTAGGHASSGGADPMGVYVETKNLGGGLSDAPFHLNVNCSAPNAVVNSDGSLVRGVSVNTTTRLGPGRYEITFNQDVSQCAYTATVGDPANALVYNPGLVFTAGGHASGGGADPMGVYVETKNLGGGLSDAPFHLSVSC